MGADKMKVLIPMAGRGERFAKSGKYTLPKPLIDVDGKPMVARVIQNLGMADSTYIFLILNEYRDALRSVISQCVEKYVLLGVDQVTQGAACTCLIAKGYINTEEPLLVANCDQIMDWKPEVFREYIEKVDMDGCIITFTSNSPKNSFAKVNRLNIVTRVAEKEVISDVATTGVYYWSEGRLMVESCMKMIAKNTRVNNEFYLCPSYNEMIEDGYIIRTLHVQKHWPIGTPEDLEAYLANK